MTYIHDLKFVMYDVIGVMSMINIYVKYLIIFIYILMKYVN